MSDPLQHLREAKVFGVGFSKTGTTTMEKACLDLGLNVCRGHWNLKHNDYHLALYVGGLHEELKLMTRYWDAFFDGPWGGDRLYLKLAEWYPEAYFIQTLRDPEQWYESLYNMVRSLREDEAKDLLDSYHGYGCQGSTLFFKHIFGIERLEDRTRIVDHFNRINDEVEKFFSRGDFRFLQMNVTEGDGWNVLAPFFGVDAPATPFPRENVLRGEVPKPVTAREPSIKPEAIKPPKRSRLRQALKWRLSRLADKL